MEEEDQIKEEDRHWICLDDGTSKNIIYLDTKTGKKSRFAPKNIHEEYFEDGRKKYYFRGVCVNCKASSPAIVLFKDNFNVAFATNNCLFCIVSQTINEIEKPLNNKIVNKITTVGKNKEKNDNSPPSPYSEFHKAVQVITNNNTTVNHSELFKLALNEFTKIPKELISKINFSAKSHMFLQLDQIATHPNRDLEITLRAIESNLLVKQEMKKTRNQLRKREVKIKAIQHGVSVGEFLSWGYESLFEEYYGQIDAKSNLPHGFGVKFYADKSIYIGEWQNGVRHSFSTKVSTWIRPDGCHYEGQFVNDFKHGIGTMTYPDGTTYTGEFAKGFEHGTGKKVYPDGGYFEGKFRYGKRDGLGVMHYPPSSNRPVKVEKKVFRMNDAFHEKPLPSVTENNNLKAILDEVVSCFPKHLVLNLSNNNYVEVLSDICKPYVKNKSKNIEELVEKNNDSEEKSEDFIKNNDEQENDKLNSNQSKAIECLLPIPILEEEYHYIQTGRYYQPLSLMHLSIKALANSVNNNEKYEKNNEKSDFLNIFNINNSQTKVDHKLIYRNKLKKIFPPITNSLIISKLPYYLKQPFALYYYSSIKPIGCLSLIHLSQSFAFQYLKRVNISHMKFSNRDIETFLYSITGNPLIKELELVNLNLGPIEITEICKKIDQSITIGEKSDPSISISSSNSQAWKFLEKLSLNFNPLDTFSLKNLLDSLKNIPNLIHLSLSGCELNHSCAIYIGKFLSNNPKLKELDLSFNNLGSSGVEPISEALKKNTNLVFLSLRQNNIGRAGGESLIRAMKSNNTLRTLVVTDNKIGIQASTALSARLRGTIKDIIRSFSAYELEIPIQHRYRKMSKKKDAETEISSGFIEEKSKFEENNNNINNNKIGGKDDNLEEEMTIEFY